MVILKYQALASWQQTRSKTFARLYVFAFMGSMLNFYQYENPKSSQILHTGPFKKLYRFPSTGFLAWLLSSSVFWKRLPLARYYSMTPPCGCLYFLFFFFLCGPKASSVLTQARNGQERISAQARPTFLVVYLLLLHRNDCSLPRAHSLFFFSLFSATDPRECRKCGYKMRLHRSRSVTQHSCYAIVVWRFGKDLFLMLRRL